VLTIIQWDNPFLKLVAQPVADSAFGSSLEALGQDMVETMVSNKGIGLAGPQVGVSSRIFVMSFPEHKDRKPIVVVNPVLKLGGWFTYEQEGCLSFPGLSEQVERQAEVVMQYKNPIGEALELVLTKWDARVAQHEFDHLNGIMFFDRVSRQVRKRLLREWEAQRGKAR
jgi:peptide deformylase